jgi:hypothetical protein
MKELF